MLNPKCQPTQLLIILLLAACIVSDSEASPWRRINGALERIVYDGEILIGLDTGVRPHWENIWIAEHNIGTDPNWHKMKGSCRDIVSENGNIWCTQSQGVTYYTFYTGGSDWEGGWSQVLGHMRQVDVFPETDLIYGTNGGNELLFADHEIAVEPNWKVIDTGVGEVKVGYSRAEEKLVAMLDTGGGIHLGTHNGQKPNWRNVRRDMRSVSFDGKIMCGIDVFAQVQYARDAEFREWKVIEGPPKFRAVECNDDKLWGLESGNGFVHFIDLREIDNSTDQPNCIKKDLQCSHPTRPCCNACLWANPTRDTRCRKHEGQGGSFSFCLPWKCGHQGDGPGTRSKAAAATTNNVTTGYITAEDLSWMTPEELAKERKAAVIARAEFQTYSAAHQRNRKGGGQGQGPPGPQF